MPAGIAACLCMIHFWEEIPVQDDLLEHIRADFQSRSAASEADFSAPEVVFITLLRLDLLCLA